MHIWNRFLHQLAGAAETGRKYNPAEDKKTGDQSNEEDRKMLYKQRIVMAAI